MCDSLSDMSLEQLWKLFPIFLVPYREEWKARYSEMAALLESSFPPGLIKRVSHIGSTSVEGLTAKDIVDILLEVSDRESVIKAAVEAEKLGFRRMSEKENRISLNFGYTPEGFAEKVFHLHIRLYGDNDELYFRDFLIERPDIAAEYEKLKLSLVEKYKNNRDGYTDAKTEFVKKYSAEARVLFGNRY